MLFPGGASGGVVVAVALSKTAVLLADAGETARLATLVHGLGDPVDSRIAADLSEQSILVRFSPLRLKRQ